MFYVGVDLHRKTSQLAVVDEHGQPVCSQRVISDRDEMLRVFGEVVPTKPWRWPSKPLMAGAGLPTCCKDLGIPTHMAHPRAKKDEDQHAACYGPSNNRIVPASRASRLVRFAVFRKP